MELLGVRVELPSNSPIALLQETGGEERLLPIFIGGAEATAIAIALENVATPRPMTHDLMQTLLQQLGAELKHVVITDLKDRTFFAELHLQRGDEELVISSRPSDAMALAARIDAPVFALEKVIESAGYRPDSDSSDDGDDDQVLEEFREFIDNVTPEDFDG